MNWIPAGATMVRRPKIRHDDRTVSGSMPVNLSGLSLSERHKTLLRRHLHFYRKLENGRRRPATALQIHFVEVCRGDATPNTEHEKAYIAYLKAREKRAQAGQNKTSRAVLLGAEEGSREVGRRVIAVRNKLGSCIGGQEVATGARRSLQGVV